MEIVVKKLTTGTLLNRACSFTLHNFKDVKVDKSKLYLSEHSPIRTQLFWVEMYNIPSFVSTHFVRHKVGVEHYISTNRDDRGGTKEENRNTPVNHAMLINAQALINIARKRLCFNAHKETIKVMQEIKRTLYNEDNDLYYYLIPECQYRGKCPEYKSCGYYDRITKKEGKQNEEKKCTTSCCSGSSLCGVYKEM